MKQEHRGGVFLKRSWEDSGLPACLAEHILARMDAASPPLAATAPARLGVRLLGGFAVAVDGAELPADRWPGLRATHLVQLLSLQPAKRATRDQVIDALWPQLEPQAGAANLRKALHNARLALGRHEAIALQGGELVLWPQGLLEVDADAFEQAAQPALRGGDAAACADAADLYTGDLLPGSRLPSSAAEAIAERLCDVPDHALSLLRWLAVSGDEFDAAPLEALARQAQVAVFPAVDAALAAGVLVVSDSRYRFRHELVRQALVGVHPSSVEGRLCEALAWSGAAALGVADPAVGTAKSAVARRLALESGDTAALVIASWAQAAAAHARGELHRSVWADLQETSHAPHLALRVFDGHLCITQRFLYGARPYAEVIAFAEAVATEARRLGAARGHAFGITLRGEAEWLAGDLASAKQHLREGARLHRAISGPVGEALSLQRLAEVALHEGRRDEACALIDEALDIARQTDVGFHLLDRIYGTRINLHAHDPDAALHVMEDASACVRGPLETCPGCRITFAVPAAIAAARAGEVDLARKHEEQCAYLANVVMRLPAWHAAHEEVRGHIEAARGDPPAAAARFGAAAGQFRQAGQPLDAARCEGLAGASGCAA